MTYADLLNGIPEKAIYFQQISTAQARQVGLSLGVLRIREGFDPNRYNRHFWRGGFSDLLGRVGASGVLGRL